MRAFLRGTLTDQSQERSPETAKRGVAELAALGSRNERKEAALSTDDWMCSGEPGAPLLLSA